MLSCQIGEQSTARGLRQEINKEGFLTACMCVFLSVCEQLLCFSLVFCTYKYWFRLNSLSCARSTGKRHWVRFTWHRSVVVGMHLACNLEVRGVFFEALLFYYAKFPHVLTLILKLFPLFPQNRTHNYARGFVLSSAQRINVFTFHAVQNMLGFSSDATKHIYNWNKTIGYR